MKIIFYALVEEELPYIREWAAKTGNEVHPVTDFLNTNSAVLAEGFDAVVTQQTKVVTPDVYETLASYGIKQIAIRQVGYDVLDIDLARQHGIRLSNVPGYSPRAIAEFTLTQLFALLRRTKIVERAIQQGDWTWETVGQTREIHELTVAVIGVGRIGTAFAQMLHALGARVLAVDPVYHAQNEPFVDYVSLDEALPQADVVSFHTPLNESTHHLGDAAFFEKLKTGAFVLNMSRGGVLDIAVVEAALASGEIAGLAIDVTENETQFMEQKQAPSEVPAEIQRLIARDDVLMSPHIAFYTDLAIKNMVAISLTDAVTLANGGHTENEILR